MMLSDLSRPPARPTRHLYWVFVAAMLCLAAILFATPGPARAAPVTINCDDHLTPPGELSRYIAHAEACIAAPPVQVSYLVQDAQAMLARVNEVRRGKGLSSLLWHEGAARTATYHGLDLVRRGYFEHQSPEGLSAQDRLRRIDRTLLHGYSGENLSYFKDGRPKSYSWHELQRGLEISPSHYRTMTSDDYTHVGIAIVKRGDIYIAVQVFLSYEGDLDHPLPALLSRDSKVELPESIAGRDVRGWKLFSARGQEMGKARGRTLQPPGTAFGEAEVVVLGEESRYSVMLIHGPIVNIRP